MVRLGAGGQDGVAEGPRVGYVAHRFDAVRAADERDRYLSLVQDARADGDVRIGQLQARARQRKYGTTKRARSHHCQRRRVSRTVMMDRAMSFTRFLY